MRRHLLSTTAFIRIPTARQYRKTQNKTAPDFRQTRFSVPRTIFENGNFRGIYNLLKIGYFGLYCKDNQLFVKVDKIA